jgi:hypothetical protein
MLPICQVFRTVQLLSMKGSILSFYGSLPALGLFVYGARGRAGLLDSSGTLLRLAPLPTHGLLRDNGLFLLTLLCGLHGLCLRHIDQQGH